MNNVNELHEALARVVFADRKFPEVLSDITAIAHQAMPGTEAASITLIRGEKPFTAAYDGQMALDADELQYEHGYGPCVDAGRAGRSSSSTTCGPSSAGRIMPSASQRTACSAHSRCRYRFRARPSARSAGGCGNRLSRAPKGVRATGAYCGWMRQSVFARACA